MSKAGDVPWEVVRSWMVAIFWPEYWQSCPWRCCFYRSNHGRNFVVKCGGGSLPVACRGLVMPGATAWLYVPLASSTIKQWLVVVIVTGCALSCCFCDVTIRRHIDASKQTFWRFVNKICILFYTHYPYLLLYNLCSKLGDRSKTQHSTLWHSSALLQKYQAAP